MDQDELNTSSLIR